MEVKEEITKNKTKIRMNEIKINALVNLLSKEGIVTSEEFEQEIEEITKDNIDED